jgi:hypothetical protein
MFSNNEYDEGYHEGYSEGYSEGYNEGYKKAKNKLMKKYLPKKMKIENNNIEKYTKNYYDKFDILNIIKNAFNKKTLIDIYYDGGTNKEWRNGCKIIKYSNNNLYVSYYNNTGINVFRTFKLNKIKFIRNNKNEIITAIKEYENFYNMRDNTANIQDVINSSAGINGWFNSALKKNDIVSKMEQLQFNMGSKSEKKRNR